MREVLLVRFGEVHLKGQNRPYFLKTLTENVRRAVKPLGGPVWLADSRITVAGVEDRRACGERVRRVFGVYSVSPAWELPKEFEVIAARCVEMMRPLSGSFKVFARRSDKHFPMNSMEIATEIGGRVLEDNAKLRVDVHHPEHRLNVEIRDHAYVCVEEWKAVGGMPMGTGGKAALLLSGGIDSPVAGYQLMKRGVTTCAIHFQSPPYTGELALDKVLRLAKILGEYENGMRVYLVPFTKVQTEIHEKCPAHHPPLHDAHRRASGAQVRRPGADYRREPRAGGQPDHGGHHLHGRGGRHARVPPAHRHGQTGDHRNCRKDRHL